MDREISASRKGLVSIDVLSHTKGMGGPITLSLALGGGWGMLRPGQRVEKRGMH